MMANREDLFAGAIHNSGILGDIYRRTPKSDKERYGNEERILLDGSVWRPGEMRLTKSVLPGGPRDTTLNRIKTYTQHTLSYTIGSSVPYAKFVHEMDGEKTRWTTPRTGSKFLEKPVRNYNDKILRELNKNILAVIRRGNQ